MSDTEAAHRNVVIPYLLYENAAAAIAWLCDVFGFEETSRMEDDGRVNHAELRIGTGEIYLGEPGGEHQSPKNGGYPGALTCVEIDDADAHHQHAKAAGATITEEPADQAYGYRRYAVEDPEGHRWYFMQPMSDVAPQDWGATTPG